MDGDDVRRGGPSVPALMRAAVRTRAGRRDEHPRGRPGRRLGAARCFSRWSSRPERVALAARELARAHEEVIAGQVLDVRSAASDAREVEAMHALKTASYTVRGPVVIGARLAGASEEQVAALAAFAEPLGVAFQLRDDVLGTFGDPVATGKPAGSDLREGKRTALVVEALARRARRRGARPRARARDASDADVREAVATHRGVRGARARRGAHRRADAVRRAPRSSAPGWPRGGRALLEPPSTR